MLQTTYYKSRDSDQGPLIIVLAQQNFTVLTAYADAPQTVKAEEYDSALSSNKGEHLLENLSKAHDSLARRHGAGEAWARGQSVR